MMRWKKLAKAGKWYYSIPYLKCEGGPKLKTFFGGFFIDQKILEASGIKHPIKLEYYKRINEDEIFELNKAKYGISIIKTEYVNNQVKVEEKCIKYLTNDEKRADYLLTTLKDNYVTPVGLEDVISDLSKQIL